MGSGRWILRFFSQKRQLIFHFVHCLVVYLIKLVASKTKLLPKSLTCKVKSGKGELLRDKDGPK